MTMVVFLANTLTIPDINKTTRNSTFLVMWKLFRFIGCLL